MAAMSRGTLRRAYIAASSSSEMPPHPVGRLARSRSDPAGWGSSATRAHGSALQESEPRYRLARVEKDRVRIRRERVDVAAGERRNAREALQEVERGALRGEDRAEWAGDSRREHPRLEAGPVRHEREVFARRPHHLEDARGRAGAAENTGALGDDLRFTHQVRVDDMMCGDVGIAHLAAEVFPQRQGDQIVELRLR